MRILQIGSIPPEIGGKTMGGVATHVWGLSTHLAKRGHEVAILADNFPSPPEIPVVRDGVMIYGLSTALVLKHLPSALPNLSTLIKLKKHFKGLIGIKAMITNFCYYDYVFHNFSPDVIHVHHLEFRFVFAHFIAKDMFPIVTTVHSTSFVKFASPAQKEENLRLIKRNALLAKDIIFGFPTRMQEFLDLLDGKERNNIRRWLVSYPMDSVLYYPLFQAEARKKANITSEKPLVLFVANLVPLKGAATLVKAVNLVHQRDGDLYFDVLIVGDGPQWEELRIMAAEHGLESQVTIAGPKFYPDLLYYYNAADLFVLPSKEEALPTTAFEAMQCGCPIIVSTNVAPEMLPPPELAHQVPVDDEKALAETIQVCLKQSWNKDKIVEYTRLFDWENGTIANIRNFENLYLSIIEKHCSSQSDQFKFKKRRVGELQTSLLKRGHK